MIGQGAPDTPILRQSFTLAAYDVEGPVSVILALNSLNKAAIREGEAITAGILHQAVVGVVCGAVVTVWYWPYSRTPQNCR